MPEIQTQRSDIRKLRGLHLWHAGLSNCSQRVRVVLEEKGLAWTSHLIDLMRFEHATPDYQRIHPKGLVPALVHDGRTFIDSNDIIVHLDGLAPEPRLRDLEHAEDQDALFALADNSQLALRTLSHELLLGDVRRLDAASLERFGRDHGNREFYQFLHRFSTEGFDDTHLASRLAEIGAALAVLDQRLADSDHLTGAAPSLADFSWIVNVHRLALIGYPLHQWSHVARWFGAMQARPSYRRALVDFEGSLPKPSAAIVARRYAIFGATEL